MRSPDVSCKHSPLKLPFGDITMTAFGVIFQLFVVWFPPHWIGLYGGSQVSLVLPWLAEALATTAIVCWLIYNTFCFLFSVRYLAFRLGMIVMLVAVPFFLPQMTNRFFDGFCEYVSNKDLDSIQQWARDTIKQYNRDRANKGGSGLERIGSDTIPVYIRKTWHIPSYCLIVFGNADEQSCIWITWGRENLRVGRREYVLPPSPFQREIKPGIYVYLSRVDT